MSLEIDTYPSNNINQRFRGFLPVVIDIETGGFKYDPNC